MEDMFRVGVIANTHGIRGEVKVYPTTDDVTRYKKLKEVLLDTGKEYKTLEIASTRFSTVLLRSIREFPTCILS